MDYDRSYNNPFQKYILYSRVVDDALRLLGCVCYRIKFLYLETKLAEALSVFFTRLNSIHKSQNFFPVFIRRIQPAVMTAMIEQNKFGFLQNLFCF